MSGSCSSAIWRLEDGRGAPATQPLLAPVVLELTPLQQALVDSLGRR